MASNITRWKPRRPPTALQRFSKSIRMRFSGYGGQQVGGYTGSGFGWLWPFMPGSRYDYAREAGDLWMNSSVMACIGWIQRNFTDAQLAICTDDDDGDQISYDKDHPMVRLIKQPNPAYSGSDLWYATILSWCVDGNAYWIKARGDNGRGVPLQLWWVPHWMLTPQWPENGSTYISHYLYQVNGEQVPVRPEDVVHFRYGIDPLTTRRGLSPLSAALREICTDNEINNYAASLMRNMGVPGLVVSPKDSNAIIPFGEEQKIQARFESAFTGDERGQTLVNTIPLDIQMPGFNPDQMAIEFLRKVPEERIAALLGLPAGVVGLGAGLDRNTFNNYAEARKAAFENNIAPTQKLMAEAMDRQLLGDFEDVADGETYVGWDYRRVRVLQEDENAKAERIGSLFEKDLIKRGEGRKEMGFQAKPEDDIYFSEIDTKNKVEIAKNTPAPAAGAGAAKKPASSKKDVDLDKDEE